MEPVPSHVALKLSSHVPLELCSHVPLELSSHVPLELSSHVPPELSSHVPPELSSHVPLELSSHEHDYPVTTLQPFSFVLASNQQRVLERSTHQQHNVALFPALLKLSSQDCLYPATTLPRDLPRRTMRCANPPLCIEQCNPCAPCCPARLPAPCEQASVPRSRGHEARVSATLGNHAEPGNCHPQKNEEPRF
uniref:Uncharacterized protein n=1 Tax=Sphaerodactylus townsendi TaxID=933632 RepID=A0ACB8G6V6_9SAUR